MPALSEGLRALQMPWVTALAQAWEKALACIPSKCHISGIFYYTSFPNS